MSTQNNPVALLKQETPQLQAIMAIYKKGQDIAVLATQEISYLETIALTKPEINQCEAISVLLAVKSVLKQNLSLDPYAGLVYVKTRNINSGTRDKPEWKKALEIQPTANGLISIARQCGRILDIKRPQVTKSAETGKITGVSVEILLPSVPQPRWETFTFDEDDFYRWQRASHNENGRNKQDANPNTFNYANPNYTNFKSGIDPEFARAKAIRHSLKKLGTNPHEVKPGQIVIDTTKTPLVDIAKDADASGDDNIHNAEIISSTINIEPSLPKTNDL
jgi:hypothetical protein